MKKPKFSGILLLLLFLLPCISHAEGPDTIASTETTFSKGRLTGVIAVQGGLYVTSMTGLYFAWYSDYPQSNFHFFDDNQEWMQMDKMGHMTTSYYISRIGYESYRWAGVKEKKSALGGAALGFVFLTHIELLDAFSKGWGFSAGDFVANTTGSLLFLSQQLAWKEQRIILKFSWHPTKFPEYRPDLLGSNTFQQLIKDYNGQTYWLSGNISAFLPDNVRFPRWLNIAAGYSAEGMTGAENNEGNVSMPEYQRYRQFFLSIDVDLSKIPTKSKTLHSIFMVLNFIKIPLPAIEYNTLGKVRFHPLFF